MRVRQHIGGGGLAHRHHARLIDEGVPYHVISRALQGRHLLRPCSELNAIAIGVIARARVLFPAVKLYAVALMSNHLHMMVQGSSAHVPFFIGFVKREISRRWGGRPEVDWPGPMWHEYLATALPTEQSQQDCLKYILSQGVKENLVERPQDWPGVHAAKALMTGTPLRGQWLDATGYARAMDAASRTEKKTIVKRANYLRDCKFDFDVLPAWSHLGARARRAEATRLVVAITREGRERREREMKSVLGADAVKKTPLHRISKLPPLPWYENRRRMICWADRRDPIVRAYVADYWAFQASFVEASRRLREGELGVAFPPRAFRPITHHAASVSAPLQ